MLNIVRKFIDLVQQKFGRLIVIKRVDNNKHGQSVWLCKCDCGKEKIVFGYNLKSGHTKSCGCLSIEKTGERFTTHGQSKTRTYDSWYNMVQRCTNPDDKNYHNYGGRGITVCKRWMKFIHFLEDMSEAPEGYQIDRIDNNKRYCKSNCQWTTAKINNRNKRNNHLITHDGKTQCLAAWAEEFNINYKTLGKRLSRGWSIKKALTTPVKKRRK